MKHLKRVVSAFLILTLLMQIVPLNTFAQGTSAESLAEEPIDAETGEKSTVETTDQAPDIQDTEVKERTPVYVLYEEESLRQGAEKHFRLSDGSFLAVGYGGDVHYQDEQGNWQEIDNTLSLTEIKDSSVAASTSQQVYESINGAQTRRFASELDDSGYLFTAASGEYSISISAIKQPLEQESTEGRASATIMAEVCNPEDKRDAISEDERRQLPLEKQTEPGKLGATVRYTNVWESTDLVYRSEGYDVKESIVISTPMNRYDYQFRISLRGLKPELENDGSISLKQPDGSEVFMIPAPYMEDASGEYSDSVKYVLNSTGDDYYLTVSADAEWINDASRSWPIVVDPTVSVSGTSLNKNILTSYVDSKHTTTKSPNNSMYLRSGYYNSSIGHAVGLIYMNTLPDVPNNCSVTDAYLELSVYSYEGTVESTHKLYATKNINFTNPETTLNNMKWTTFISSILPNYASTGVDTAATVIDFKKESTIPSGRSNTTPYRKTQYNITGIAQCWYDENDESGISRLLVIDDGHTSTTNARVSYAGYSYGSSYFYPKFYVSYRNDVGIEDIYDCHMQDIGRAGTGIVSNHTLKSTLIVPLISSPSETLPFTLSLIYNAGISNSQFTYDSVKEIHTLNFTTSGVGYGWKISAQQTIRSMNDENNIIYTDTDGTEHYLQKVSVNGDTGEITYKDEDGLGLTVTAYGSQYTMQDLEKNTWEFSSGYLTSYTTSEGNSLFYAYNGVPYADNTSGWKPTSYSQANRITSIWRKNNGCDSQKVATLEYYNNRLVRVKDAANRTTEIYYDSTLTVMKEIHFPDYTDSPNRKALYTYDASHGYYRLVSATDYEAKYQVQYDYLNNYPTRVSQIREYTWTTSSDSLELGEKVNCYLCNASYARFRYFQPGDPEQTSTNPGGRLVTQHYFDSYGRTINIITLNASETEVFGSSTGSYTEADGTSSKNNRLTSAASAGIQSRNLLNNGGLEGAGNSSSWYSVGSGTTSWASSLGQYLPHTGTKMMQLSSSDSGDENARKFRQSVSLAAGKTYVFSCYVNTGSASNLGNDSVYLEITDEHNNTWKSLPVDYQTGNSINRGWTRLECSFTTACDDNHWLAAVIKNNAANVLVDDFQLEELSNSGTQSITEGTASTLNLLQLSGFEEPTGSHAQTQPSVSDWWSMGIDASQYTKVPHVSDPLVHTGETSLKLSPNPNGQTRASQAVAINDVAAKTYLLSAWGLTPQTNLDNGITPSGTNTNKARFFGIVAKVQYLNNAYPAEYYYMPFDGNISKWQYASTAIVPKQAEEHPDAIVSWITVSAALDYCANTAYVDDVSLVAEPVQTYDYDDDGNLIMASNSEGQATTEYDSAGRLTQYTNSAGVTYKQFYSGDNRNPYATKYDDLYQRFTYDDAGHITESKTYKTSSSYYLKNTVNYDNDNRDQDYGNFRKQETDVNGVTVDYDFDEDTGLMMETTIGGRTVVSSYDAHNDRLLSQTQPDGETNIAGIFYHYDTDGSLQYLARESHSDNSTTWQTYGFTYDSWGRTTKIDVSLQGNVTRSESERNSQTLAAYDYDVDTGNLKEMDYPNGDYVKYTYDVFDRLIREVYYNRRGQVKADYRYVYNADGILAKQYRISGGSIIEAYTFEYDSLGRLIRSKELGSGGSTVQRTEHLYDTANRLTEQHWKIGNRVFGETYTYRANDGLLATMEAASFELLTYQYDSLKRLISTTVEQQDNSSYCPFEIKQSYVNKSGSQTTTQVEYYNYRTAGGALIAGNKYEYDALGNISKIYECGATNRLISEYTYDDENQLIEEKRHTYGDPATTTTITYTYDTAGNLTAVTERDGNNQVVSTMSYDYDNQNWADQLTGVTYQTAAGTSSGIINYDYQSGNPTNWYNGSDKVYTYLGWEQGRRLTGIQYEDSEEQYQMEFAYDMSGIRTRKVTDDGTHNYVTQNGKVVRETFGTKVLEFVYDANGRPFVLNYSTNSGSSFTKYYYVLNAQGDVVGLLNSSGTLIVKYTYDAWGKLLSVTNASGTEITATTSIAHVNPLRYRGYYWDSETGWYYLQSRYYDPIVKRFLNADVYTSTGQGFIGCNMFAYCTNNPACYYDTGEYKVAIFYDLSFPGYNPYGLAGLGLASLNYLIEYLCSTLGIPGWLNDDTLELELHGFSTVDEFIEEWNSMSGVYDAIFIYAHGSEGRPGLFAGDGYIGNNGKDTSFNQLHSIKINYALFLFCCYGAQVGADGYSTAQWFANLTSAPVIASPGKVWTIFVGGIVFPENGAGWEVVMPTPVIHL